MKRNDEESRDAKRRLTIEVVRVRSGVRAGGGGYECDNSFGSCGTPDQSGGGGSGSGGGSVLVANT